MTSLIRSTLLGFRGVARPSFTAPSSTASVSASASFASSSRHGLDFTRPLLDSKPLPTKGTLTIEEQVTEEGFAAEPESSADASVGSHTSPSTSNAAPEVVPTPQPRLSINTPPTPSPTLSGTSSGSTSTPQFNIPSSSSTTRLAPTGASAGSPVKGKKGVPSGRWAIESSKIGAGERTLLPTHTLHVKSTRNNIILSLTDGLGPVFSTVSGGTDRTFKNSQRSSYEAATQASTKMFDKIVEWSRTLGHQDRPKIRIAFNGLFGMGREAFAGALAGPEGQEMRSLVARVEDRTRIKIGGARAPKPRRL
ncbi:hypothetical protein IAT40_007789 [Kwoniella sp. CBS 6097]